MVRTVYAHKRNHDNVAHRNAWLKYYVGIWAVLSLTDLSLTRKLISSSIYRCGETPGEEFDILPDFAASCHGLEKFYVKRSDSEKNPRLPIIDSKFFKCIIQCSGTLRVLNLADCSLNLDEVKHIVTLCLELRELNINAWGFAWEHDFLCEDSIDFLCKNLTTKIEKLNLVTLYFCALLGLFK